MNLTESEIREFQDMIQRAMDEPLKDGSQRTQIFPYILPGAEKYLPEGIRLTDWSGSTDGDLRCCRLVRC